MSSLALGRLSAIPADVWNLIGDSVPADVAPKRGGSFEVHDLQHHRALIDLGYSADWGIPRPKDLHNLAMTCRALYDLYTSVLFRHVHVGVNRLEAFLAALDKTPHLYQHMRSLTFHRHHGPQSRLNEVEYNRSLQWEIASKASNLITLRIEPPSDPSCILAVSNLEVLWLGWIKADPSEVDPIQPVNVDLGSLLGPSVHPRVLCAEGIDVFSCPMLLHHLDRVQHLTLQCAFKQGSLLSVGQYLQFATELTDLKLTFRTADWPMILQHKPSVWPEACRRNLRSIELYRHRFFYGDDEAGVPIVRPPPRTVDEVFADEPEQSPSLLSSFSDFCALEQLTMPIGHLSALHPVDPLPAALKILTFEIPWADFIHFEEVSAIQIDGLKVLCSHAWECLKTYISDGRAPALKEIRMGRAVPWLYWALQHSLTFPDGKDEIDNFERFRSYCASQGIAVKVETLTFEEYWRKWWRLQGKDTLETSAADVDTILVRPKRPSKSLVYRYLEMAYEGEDNNRAGVEPPSPGTDDAYITPDAASDASDASDFADGFSSEKEVADRQSEAHEGGHSELVLYDANSIPISHPAYMDMDGDPRDTEFN